MKQSNIPNEAACGSESNAIAHSQAHAYAGESGKSHGNNPF